MSKEYIVPLSEDEAFYGYKGMTVELIRCKDCKYAYKTFNSYTCQRVFHPFTIEDDGFCSWAERRTDETD